MLPVVFYNTENLFDATDDRTNRGDDEFTPDGIKSWNNKRYELKIERVAKALCLMNGELPAIAGMCELENREVLEKLVQTPLLSKVGYQIVHRESEDPRGIDCGLIYDPSKVTFVAAKFHQVSIASERHFRTRDIVEAKFTIGAKELYVFVNHWPSRKEGLAETKNRRIAAAKLLRKRVDELLQQNPLTNVLIMGDFNDTPNDESLKQVLRAKGQHELSKNDLINLLIEEENKDLGTHLFRGDWIVFDQMIVSQGLLQGRNGLEIHKSNAFILKHEQLLTKKGADVLLNPTFAGDNYMGGYSDHLPVYLHIKPKK